jgi:hypothetical protein
MNFWVEFGWAGSAGLRSDFSAGDQFVQSRPGFGSIGFLRAVLAGRDAHQPFRRGALAAYREEGLPYAVGEDCRLPASKRS